jgi:plasmid stability protein
MHALSLRGLSDDVYDDLKRWAKRSHRSLHEQVKTILVREVGLATEAPPSPLRWRARLKARRWGNIVADIRKERSR